MARNFQEPITGLDRCVYYKAEYVTNNKLTQGAEPEGIFYSNDVDKFTEEINVSGVSRVVQTRGVIETKDFIPTLTVDDFVLLDGDLYIVEKLEKKDIRDKAKQFRRHAYHTYISLRK